MLNYINIIYKNNQIIKILKFYIFSSKKYVKIQINIEFIANKNEIIANLLRKQ